MRVYHFTEQPYYPTWNDHSGSLRVNLPNEKCDPHVASDLFHRYYDEWQLADDLGFDIMLNEHHQTATCMSSTVVVGMSILARITKKARILVLGYPIGHRPDPLRIAEELSAIDVISRGRLDMGFVKGVPYEFPASNQNPVGVMDRFWEALDFITKAMTTHDRLFNWEGEYFHYRQVNVWPRVWQQPHPPVWSTTGSTTQARLLGERGYTMATLGSGYNTRPLYDAYRRGHMAKWGKAAPPDRFAYLGLVAVSHDKDEARKRGDLVAGYLRSSSIVHVPFRNPPGFLSVEDNMRLLRGERPPRSFTKDGRAINMATASVDELIDAGILFCGTPDEVYEQIIDFCDYCGGMGNLLMMGHAGFLTHEQTTDNLTLFAREVYPRLKAWQQPNADKVTAAAMAEKAPAPGTASVRPGDLVDAGIAAN
jgi:alkanesulfonate monooxygenase SsuD/methylene tetrahydromethanopterin reductase-like flavin-dependent oxidoreductase (luciferase family)